MPRPLRPRARRARRIEIRACGRCSSTPAGSRQPGRLNLGTVVLGEARSPHLAQVATVAESAGLKGFNVSSWSALAAPAKTPAHIVARLARETRQVLESAEVKKQFADLSVQARASSPEQLAALLDSEIRRWSDVIARAGIPRQ